MMKKFVTYNLGCKVNEYECDAIANLLEDNGYTLDKKNPIANCDRILLYKFIVY